MNSKVAKILRKAALLVNKPYEMIKNNYKKLNSEKRREVLLKLRQRINFPLPDQPVTDVMKEGESK
jgi:hypothetical protein